jgi:hypothetical protein
VHGLVALMELAASRAAARTGPAGEPVPLHEQDRGRWDPVHVRRGFTAMLRARDGGARGGSPGPYVLQAAIAVCHAQARRSEDTDWAAIATLYDRLAALLPTPVVALNRAVAVGRAHGPEAGLALVDALRDDPRLRDYHLLPGVRADLLDRLGRGEEARREYARAAALTRNDAERAVLAARAAGHTPPTGTTVEDRAAVFLAGLGAPAARAYGQTLRRLVRGLGGTTPATSLTADDVARVVTASWGQAAAATWNRHRAAVRSFAAWLDRPDLAAGLERRQGEAPPRPPVDPARVAVLCDDPALPVRERALWSLLHESGAPVRAVLALDVDDLDRDDRSTHDRAVVWRARTARLLDALLDGRTRGPVFLADRRPGPARARTSADRCPDTGRTRLSYERAEYLFKRATGREATLRRLRVRA